jgi:hypothetical protein
MLEEVVQLHLIIVQLFSQEVEDQEVRVVVVKVVT